MTTGSLPSLFDVNCAVGEWPFRRVPCSTVDRLVERMDRVGIRRAAVSRLENVFFKDTLVGNRELADLIAPHADRFLPLYTINPAFPGWETDLEICVQELGLLAGRGGIRLYPSYHAYQLDGPETAALLERIATLDVPLVVATRLEDERTHHWLVKVPPVPQDQLVAAVGAVPNVRWVITGLRAPQARAAWLALAERGFGDASRVVFDLSLVQGPIDECALLVEAIGSGRLAFGTNLPLTTPEAPMLALQHAELSPAIKEQIASGNAARVFGTT
jgi:hypothetical protein